MIDATVAPSWSSLAWRGFASIVFAIVALAWPGITLAALTLMFGAYALADGVLALTTAARRQQPHRWLLVIDGLFGIAAGVLTLLVPGLTLLALLFVAGVRFLFMGGFQIALAVKMRKEVALAVLYALGGIAAIITGVLTFLVPGVTAFVLLTMLGAYAFVFGVLQLVLAFRLRRSQHGPVQTPVSA
jgi:uncharacterized membrane protein HdeD (DUF308 family)